MTESFWQKLEQPIIGLAPMDGVTDAAFRYIVAKYGRPSLIITEFTSVEGIRAGAERLLDDFYYNPIERPVVAQLFGADPQAFYVGAVAAAALGFDGIDINMGCPAKNITERGAGAALIGDPERAKEIIRQTRAGVAVWADGIDLRQAGLPEGISSLIEKRQGELGLPHPPRAQLPVSVKTRLGIEKNIVTDWVSHLLEESPVAITIHGRTLKQLYTGLADWEAIGQAATLIRQTPTLVLGNGDLPDLTEAHRRIAAYNLNGALIGRSSFGNPWIFQNQEATLQEKMAVALEHSRYLNSIFPGRGFIRIRKHLMDYTKGGEGAKELRLQLMKVNSLEDVESILAPT